MWDTAPRIDFLYTSRAGTTVMSTEVVGARRWSSDCVGWKAGRQVGAVLRRHPIGISCRLNLQQANLVGHAGSTGGAAFRHSLRICIRTILQLVCMSAPVVEATRMKIGTIPSSREKNATGGYNGFNPWSVRNSRSLLMDPSSASVAVCGMVSEFC